MNPTIPQSVENIIIKSTAKNPKNRYETVKEMYTAFARYYEEVKLTPIILPYYHLGSSDFYHLVWCEKNRPPYNGNTPSEKYLRENLLYAKFDDELWEILQDAESREYIRRNIITRFLTKQ